MRLQNMAENIQPTHTDYIVIMGGVNDRAWPITPYSAMTASLEQIVATSGEPADHVVISAIAPARQFSALRQRVERAGAGSRDAARLALHRPLGTAQGC
jgi:lysophospholipase L1-like esterase